MWIVMDWDCFTHKPVIKTVMDLYKPKFVLELGIGVHSTPLFLEYDSCYKGIENSMEWIDLMKEKVTADFVFHDLGEGIETGTLLQTLSALQVKKIIDDYDKMKLPKLRPNLLFVDQWACNRILSVNTLKKRFDLIIYHDCEPKYESEYSYSLIDFRGFNNYILKTSKSWTGIMIRKNFDKGYDLLLKKLIPYMLDFKEKYPESIPLEFCKL
jgi:hypothetical protein